MTEGRFFCSALSTRVYTTTARATAISTARKLLVLTIISSIPVILAQNNTTSLTENISGTATSSLLSYNVTSTTSLPTTSDPNGKFTIFML